ncbi:polyprenyl synthetase family protein [Bacillus sp. J37]|uniref:polyprenyl synthetase family protein n=1 Tax=Bacillus sp. J37 TaxID=935837 RepID=UPI00047C3220|nr:polyprenyl synthetase family protein [Bacillus sp. J37]
MSQKRIVFSRLLKKKQIQEQLTSFDIDQVIEEVSSRSFFFSDWMMTHVNGITATDERHEQLGAIVDLLVYLTDQLDDIQDGDIHDENGLIMNQAFMLMPLALSLLDELPFPLLTINKMKQLCCNLLVDSANGQASDLKNGVQNEVDYFKMVMQKSGALFALAGSIGAIAAGVEDNRLLEQIKDHSRYLGVVAQIYNDIDAIYQLTTNTDLQNRRRILPILYMMHDFDGIIGKYYRSELTYNELIQLKNNVIREFECKGAMPFCHFYIKRFEKQYIQAVKQNPLYSHDLKNFISYIERMN